MPRKKAVKIRRVWSIDPSTRIKKSEKLYRRTRAKKKTKRMVRDEAETRHTKRKPAGEHDKDI